MIVKTVAGMTVMSIMGLTRLTLERPTGEKMPITPVKTEMLKPTKPTQIM